MCPHICYKAPLISMKIVVAFIALLLACGAGTLKAQNSNSFKSINKQAALNFIDDISFIPQGFSNLMVNTATAFNTTAPINTITEVMADALMNNSIEKIPATQFKYAMIMDVDVEQLKDASLYSFIDEWYGTHYRMGGTTKKGIDCSAFSGTLLSAIYSFNVPRTAREQYKVCEHLNKEDLLSGDLVFFNTRGGVSHVGVYLTNGYFVHSSSSNGVKISSLDEDYYSRKFICGGRVNQ